MYFGKTTRKLQDLIKKYKAIFGYNPNGEMSVEYDESEYENYVKDLEKAISEKKHLSDIVEQEEESEDK